MKKLRKFQFWTKKSSYKNNGCPKDLRIYIGVSCTLLLLGVDRHEDDIFREVIDLVRREVGQVSAFKRAIILPTLPKVC